MEKYRLMMYDLSLSILDIANNSLAANATELDIEIYVLKKLNKIFISIKDNGKGMNEETLKNVVNPFYTSRTTRKIGLGIPFFKEIADTCDGEFNITSVVDVGTTISISAELDHWDLPPIGDIGETIATIIQAKPIDVTFLYKTDDKEELFDTKEVKKELEDVDITNPMIISWIREYINQLMI